MGLNPHWNQFNVAPVNNGTVIMVGHRGALRSGIQRQNAINLLAWLTIATEATPEEIAEEIAQASAPTPGVSSPALLRNDGALRVVDKTGKETVIPIARPVPGVAVVDENRQRMVWKIPGGATGEG